VAQIIYTDNGAAGAHAARLDASHKSEDERNTISSGADCLRYRSGQDFRSISQYRLIDSSPSDFVTYQNGLPASRRSPIQVLTGPGVD